MALPAVETPYNALPPRYIRLLNVNGTFEAGFTYSLVELLLDDAPPYETVSYVWGNQIRSVALKLRSNSTVIITPSLNETLQYLSIHCKSTYLWVDQICINQTDRSERSQQVMIMGEIYSRAKSVLVWLDTNESDAVIMESPTLTMDRQCDAVRNVLQLPWFGRAWVVQEAVLPPRVYFFLGARRFSIDGLWARVRTARDFEDEHGTNTPAAVSIRQMPGCLVLLEMTRMRLERRKKRKGCFYYTLSTFAPRCHTTKPEDSIFGFLGLVDDTNIRMTADYSMDPMMVPTLATREIIEGTQSLDLFGSLHRVVSDPSGWPELPSWVPHWTKRLRSEAMVFYKSPNYFRASAGRPHKRQSAGCAASSQLHVSGKCIERVRHTFASADHGQQPSSNSYGWDIRRYLNLARLLKQVTAVWSKEFQPLTMDRLLQTLLADGSFAFDEGARELCRNGLSESYIGRVLEVYDSLQVPHVDLSADNRALASSLRDHARVAWGRTVFLGETGVLGLAHNNVERGDLVCIIHGSKVPLVLRPVAGDQYLLMGQCYMEGVMRGEATKDWNEQDADHFVLV